MPPPLTRPWRAATTVVRRWLRALPARAPVVVLAGPQPDGLAAATLLRRALRLAGWSVTLVIPAKGAPAWGAATLQRVGEIWPAGVIAAGVGSPSAWPIDAPPLLALDHRPLPPAPPGVIAISGAGWAPPPSTSTLAYWLMQSLADVRRRDWVAALGALSAFGERTDQALAVAARNTHGASWFHDLLALLRAAGRAAAPTGEATVSLLAGARDPRDALQTDRPERTRLLAARAEVEDAIAAARDVPALLIEPLVVVRVTSPCLIHGVLAAVWQARHPDRPVLIGNDGYLPGRIAFAEAWPSSLPAPVPPPGVVFDLATADDPTSTFHIAVADWPGLLRRSGVPASAWPRSYRTSGDRFT